MREMKDSGVEWIGEIPLGWTVGRIKYNYYLKGRIGWQGLKADEFIEEGPYLVTGTDFCGGRINWNTCYHISEERYEEAPEIHVQLNDLLITKDGTVGKVAYIDSKPEKVSLNSHLLIMRPNNREYNNRYLFWVIQSPVFERFFLASQSGTIMSSLSQEKINDFSFAMPSEPKQECIANYLDSKCSKIDEIIAKQEQIIEKLKEYKLSVITEAVTKGLDPNVEMKESKIEFCDYIPTHWEISQNRYLFTLRDEKNYKPLEDVQLLSLYTDLGVFPHGEQEERGNKAVTADGYKVVYENDIVVNIILAWMGAIGRSAYDGVTSPAYDIYKPYLNVCSRFYHYLYRTKAFSAECYKYGRGIMAMRWRTYSSEFKSIRVPVPPYDEQVRIAEYLDEKCAFIEKSIKDRINAVSKLQEYKKSLIYEVVTGKKEV